METTLNKNFDNFIKDGIKSVAHQDMMLFMTTTIMSTPEWGLRQMINGLEMYCVGHEKYGMKAGDDGYTSQYVEEILHGLRGLLSAIGRFDGGTIDKTLCEIAEKHNIELN